MRTAHILQSVCLLVAASVGVGGGVSAQTTFDDFSGTTIEEAAVYLIANSTEGDSRIEAAVTVKQERTIGATDGEASTFQRRPAAVPHGDGE